MSVELQSLITKLNPTCRRCFEKAADLCVKHTNFNVEIEHLLSRLIDMPESEFVTILRYYEAPLANVRAELSMAVERLKRGNARTPAMSPYILALLREAWLVSSIRLGSSVIRSGGIALAVIDHDPIRGPLLEGIPSLRRIPRDRLRADLVELVRGSAEAGESPPAARPGAAEGEAAFAPSRTETPALDQYTIDLTEEARRNRIDPIEARESEIGQLIDILTRRRQNNPILTGDAGVGKTAVVEGLALRIVKKDVPPPLQGVALKTLDLGLLQAGAGLKGEFEERLKSVINEVKRSPQPIILFIDEAHTLIGAGGQAGQGDAANLLKPALARGELRTIAATTWSEYKAHFEKDPALTRRFQVVKVNEPTEENAIIMLRGVVRNLERHHGVRILDEAVRDAVRLSHRYISGRLLPDKAISVLDTACARVTVGQNSTPPVLEAAIQRSRRIEEERRILEREQLTGADHAVRLEEIEVELKRLAALESELRERWQNELTAIQQIRRLEEALEELRQRTPLPEEEIDDRRDELAREKGRLAALQGKDPMLSTWVDGNVVAKVISNWTGIPVGKMMLDEVQIILRLKEEMEQRIIGQPHALTAIARRIQTYHANLDDPSRPVGVFLLTGPSGVGKTETAITLADLLYGGEHNMITVNMSEYQEAHTVSSLKGAPPGYVGYGKGGVLTEAVRRNPYSVVLLDEVEKAHPDVLELFYQVFDKGALEDGEGIPVDFRNTLILLTSNVGSEITSELFERCFPEEPPLDDLQKELRRELTNHFSPAFLGRLVVVPYFPLGDVELYRIVRLKLNKIQQRFHDNHKARLNYDESLIMQIVNRCNEAQSGARNIDHILTDTLLPTLSVEILKRTLEGKGFAEIDVSFDEQGGTRAVFHDSPQTAAAKVPLLAAPERLEGVREDEKEGEDLDSLLDWLKSS